MEDTKRIKKRKTYEVKFTRLELVHLRDLLGMVLPPDASKTVSQSLAELEGRTLVETLLWKKIATACELAELPLGEDAPDYVIAPTSTPAMSVFQMASDPQGEEQTAHDESPAGFILEG